MLREIRLQKYSRRCISFRPQILSSLVLLEKKSYDSKNNLFYINDTQYDTNYQLYLSHSLNKKVHDNAEFIENSPILLILSQEPHYLIIEEEYSITLKDYLADKQKQTGLPYINQLQAKQIIFDLIKSLESYTINNLDYNCLTQTNIVRCRGKWMLSLAGLLVNHQSFNNHYYDKEDKKKQTICYSLTTLLFKLVFGFIPFESINKKPNELTFANYISYLEKYEKNKKMLKIYYFAERVDKISSKLKNLISECLSSDKIKKAEDFLSFDFFHEFGYQQECQLKKQFIQNSEIKMISSFNHKYHSLIMASIQYKKKNPYEIMHQKTQIDIVNFLELRQTYKKDPLLSFLHFAPIAVQSQIKKQAEDVNNNLRIGCSYFNREFQYGEGEKPTLELIKFIDQDKLKFPHLYEQDPYRQSKIKLYAYPYTIIYELVNVFSTQPAQIKKKIQSLITFLFNVSSIYWPIKGLEQLHGKTEEKIKFEDIKFKYRQLINFLYKHFLMEAMKKYNAKKQNLNINEKIKLKEEGLEYYRLCLKLMQVSVIVRKNGNDLDLQRIQTSQRKQIENDLQNLLKTYFPNKIEIK